LRFDLFDIVAQDGAGDQRVSGTRYPLGEDVARSILIGASGVGNREQGDVDRAEGAVLVDGHQRSPVDI
jgi:hypothetical protein